MKALLTPRLLNYLIKKNYQYFLTQTTCIDEEDAYVGITLKPVKKHPLLQKLPRPFGAYCSIFFEPLRTISGTANTKVLVELNARDLENFQNLSNLSTT